MKKSHLTQLGETEIEVLQHVWALESATVSDVRDRILETRPIAYTTVMTVLQKLAKKGFLTFSASGNSYTYSAARPREDVQKSILDDIVGKVFSGSQLALVRSLVSDEEISEAELDELQRLIDERRKEGGK